MDEKDNEATMDVDGEDHGMGDGPSTNGLSRSDFQSFDASLDASEVDDMEYEEDLGVITFPVELSRRGLLPTGCCYDDRMKLHANADFGPKPHHPEDPSRIEHIMMAFKKAGLVYTGLDSDLAAIMKDNPTKYMWRIPAREATREEICTVHHPTHFAWVRELSTKSTHDLRHLSRIMDQGRQSLYVGSMTYEAALISAGGAIETCKNVVAGNLKNAFAVIRPPGHHAEFDEPMGFCLFNNVPIAAKVCQADYPELCRKVLVLDWDVHHGNGIQNMFYDDPNVLYISLHVYQNGSFYPGKPENPMIPDGGMENCGSGVGLGRNVNIGWHDQGMGDGEYMAAFQKIVMPIAHEFNPDLVIISAGFDAAAGDELGGCFVTPSCYAHMTHMLMSLAGGKVAVCLEGGYNLKAISMSALAVARTLMGEPPPQMEIPKINRDAALVLAKCQAYQAPFWECMRPGVIDVQEMQATGAARLHDVVRAAQKQTLSRQFDMIPLYIQRETLFKAYENQVLVTRDIQASQRLIVIIHDPPQLHAQPDPLDNTVDAHNSWVSDNIGSYIEWAVKKNFGVMDVNIPYYVTRPQDTDPFTPRATEAAMQLQAQELMCYLWDNYIQLWDKADKIFFVGVGNAYIGIKLLLMSRDIKNRISGVVNFVNGNLRPVKSETDPTLSLWYKEHSLVFVAADHACWSNPDLEKRVRKRRFGTVVRSKKSELAHMMQQHFAEVQEYITKELGLDQSDTTDDDKEI